MKIAALTILFTLPSIGMIQEKFRIDPQSLSIPKRLQNLSVYHEENEFHVVKDGMDSIVKSHRMDSLLLRLKKNRPELQSYLQSAGYLTVGESEDGQLSLSASSRLAGGGGVGATVGCYVGKFLVHFVAHGTILVVGVMTGPAAPATIASLEATFLPAIEAASNVGAITGGLIGGVVTGPV